LQTSARGPQLIPQPIVDGRVEAESSRLAGVTGVRGPSPASRFHGLGTGT
jgi:hypothetical protein